MDEEERARRAEELRQVILEGCAKDARKAFKNCKPLRSVGLLVAQYWDDEADDAVHGRYVCSELETPDVEAALGRGDAHSNERDRVNLPSFTKKRSPPYIQRRGTRTAALSLRSPPTAAKAATNAAPRKTTTPSTRSSFATAASKPSGPSFGHTSMGTQRRA